jgi:hypothetical protein
VFYAPLSAKNANICDICGIECGCQTSKEKIWFPQVLYEVIVENVPKFLIV